MSSSESLWTVDSDWNRNGLDPTLQDEAGSDCGTCVLYQWVSCWWNSWWTNSSENCSEDSVLLACFLHEESRQMRRATGQRAKAWRRQYRKRGLQYVVDYYLQPVSTEDSTPSAAEILDNDRVIVTGARLGPARCGRRLRSVSTSENSSSSFSAVGQGSCSVTATSGKWWQHEHSMCWRHAVSCWGAASENALSGARSA